MIDKCKELLEKYRSLIAYAFFGVCTTLVNVASYYALFNLLRIDNVVSTIVAWFLAVAFAFATNKFWVFDSKSTERKRLLYEIATFFGCRAATGVMDVVIMYLAVDVFAWNAVIWKVISNVLTIIINYIASKLIIFRKKRKN